jgi:hypothetical protein
MTGLRNSENYRELAERWYIRQSQPTICGCGHAKVVAVRSITPAFGVGDDGTAVALYGA